MRITHNRKEFREINKTNDIEGTHAGSLKKGITTHRILDPQNPNYGRYNPEALDKPGLQTMFDGLGSQYPEKDRKPKAKPNLKQERPDVKY